MDNPQSTSVPNVHVLDRMNVAESGSTTTVQYYGTDLAAAFEYDAGPPGLSGQHGNQAPERRF